MGQAVFKYGPAAFLNLRKLALIWGVVIPLIMEQRIISFNLRRRFSVGGPGNTSLRARPARWTSCGWVHTLTIDAISGAVVLFFMGALGSAGRGCLLLHFFDLVSGINRAAAANQLQDFDRGRGHGQVGELLPGWYTTSGSKLLDNRIGIEIPAASESGSGSPNSHRDCSTPLPHFG